MQQYTPAPPGSRLFLDFTRDQFCQKSLDRSGLCGEPAVISGSTAWAPDGLRFSGGYAKVENNDNIDILSASPQKPVIWWFDMQLKNPTRYGWFFRKAFENNSISSQYGAYISTDQYTLQIRVNASSSSIDIVSPVFRRKERFLLVIYWNGEKIYGYINGKLLAQNTLVTTIPSGGYLCIGSRDPGSSSYFDGNIFQCGITIGASVSEFHEWYRKIPQDR